MVVDERLRLILVTDGQGDLGRIEHVVRRAWSGGCRCVQLREPGWSAAELVSACARLRALTAGEGGVLLVNDRVDVAAAGYADGAQVGHRSLPPAEARAVLGAGRWLGYSAHDAEQLEQARGASCDFALLSPVWRTTSKPGVDPLGVARAGQLTERAGLPVIWLGGVTAAACGQLAGLGAGARPYGVAVMSALMRAGDPELATREILSALR